MKPNEDPGSYAGPHQRSLLVRFAHNPLVSKQFFLTGGTALSVFYLHHRVSDDLDFFTTEDVNMADLSLWLKAEWKEGYSLIRSTPAYLSALMDGVRVDFVLDHLSDKDGRPQVLVEQNPLSVDTVQNIAANKLCTLVSRTEPKDIIDFFFLMTEVPDLSFEALFTSARKREALLDDPPTAAYQLEENFQFFKEHPQLRPRLLKPFDIQAVSLLYNDVINKLYHRPKL